MQKHPTNKSESGFTLIEMLIVIAIIGILASVAIPQYSQYKIRGYDAQTKQALKNMHLLCNAYWLDTSALQGCDLQKLKSRLTVLIRTRMLQQPYPPRHGIIFVHRQNITIVLTNSVLTVRR